MARKNQVLTGLFVLLFGGFLYAIHDLLEQHVVEAGESAPKFAVTTEQGQKVTSSEFGGKLLVVNFWATWCPPCVEEMPSLNEFARTLRPSGVVVLGVSVDKNEQAYKRFVQQSGLEFLTARDAEQNISSNYGTFKWPETYVIDRTGKVVLKYVGPQTWTNPQILDSVKKYL